MKKNKIKIFLQIIGPLIFIYILSKIDYRLFLIEAKLLKWHFLLFAFGLTIMEVIVKSLRWRVILMSLEITISRISCLGLYWLGVFAGTITPGRLGEVIKVYFLKNKGHSAFRSFFSIILDRISDILVLLLFGLFISLFFLRNIGFYVLVIGIILLIGIIFIFSLINSKSFIYKIFGRYIKKIIPIDLNNYNRFNFSKFWNGIKLLKKKEIIIFFFYLVISWFLYFYPRYVIAQSLRLKLSFIDIVIISTVLSIVSILPISVAGIGTREATVIYLFSLFKLNKETAVLFSLMIFTVNIIVVSFGLIPYLKELVLIKKFKLNKIT
ncbi:lysylphosphatidylglycerol synthase transmembrane domain-containing protein [Patescibacteria group bacterium]